MLVAIGRVVDFLAWVGLSLANEATITTLEKHSLGIQVKASQQPKA